MTAQSMAVFQYKTTKDIENGLCDPCVKMVDKKTLIREIHAHARHFRTARHNISIVGCLFSGSLKERRLILEKALLDGVRCKSSRATFPTRICGYSQLNTVDIRDNNGATQYLYRAATRAYFSRHTTCIHTCTSNDQKSLDRPIVYAGVHQELASLASLEMKITSYTPVNEGHGGSALSLSLSLATGRVFLPVTSVLRSPVIIMLNDSAEVRVNAPTLTSTGSYSLDMERGCSMHLRCGPIGSDWIQISSSIIRTTSQVQIHGGEPVCRMFPSTMRINVIIVIVGTRAIANFTPFQIFYTILMALHGLATRKVAKESLDRVQVGVYDACIAGCSNAGMAGGGFFYDI
ncbi:hypothetical protein G5I_11861 [Acromyrmex echinatior]|uniref:Uncharacterized protein n=1 Tax=Acromyrmex echinatior TaxID=103372 RepID=F4X0G1_ACREC|nr:hypothetical protein G5I_11861 [Acromyrmex echinatior]